GSYEPLVSWCERGRLAGCRGRGAYGLGVGLGQVLVDLALVNRDALRDTDPDDRLAVHVELLRELLGRQVIRHRALPPSSDKKARRRVCVRAGSILAPLLSAGVNGPASRKRPYAPRILVGAGGPQRGAGEALVSPRAPLHAHQATVCLRR